MSMKNYVGLAQAMGRKDKNWEEAKGKIQRMVKTLPSGSGFDFGIKFLSNLSSENRLVFQADFHHMNENGYYDGWTEHRITVTPSLSHGIEIKISGKNKNDIKEYISDVIGCWLEQDCTWWLPEEGGEQ